MGFSNKNIACIEKPTASWFSCGEDHADHAISNEIRSQSLAIVLPVIGDLGKQTSGVAVGSTQGFAFAAENDFSSMNIVDNYFSVVRMAILYKQFLAGCSSPEYATELLIALSEENYFRKRGSDFYYDIRERISVRKENNFLRVTDDKVDLRLECAYLLNNIRFNYLLPNSYFTRSAVLAKLQTMAQENLFHMVCTDIFRYKPPTAVSFVYFSNLFEWGEHEKKEISGLPWIERGTVSLYSSSPDGCYDYCDYIGGYSKERWGYRFSPSIKVT
jgi:hypothetical protein